MSRLATHIHVPELDDNGDGGWFYGTRYEVWRDAPLLAGMIGSVKGAEIFDDPYYCTIELARPVELTT